MVALHTVASSMFPRKKKIRSQTLCKVSLSPKKKENSKPNTLQNFPDSIRFNVYLYFSSMAKLSASCAS